MTSLTKLQADIADCLATRPLHRKLARRLARCKTGSNCNQCGDVCPVRAKHDRRNDLARMKRLFRKQAQARHFFLSRNTWCCGSGHLADANVKTVFKATRRALNTLQETSIIGVGMADAYWSLTEWRVGVAAIVAVPASVDTYRAFDHTKDIVGPLEIVSVTDVGEALEKLFTNSQRAKRGGPFEDERVRPKDKLREEYYCWLASMEPGERVFRYGCDRYLNPLKKPQRLLHLRPKKGHPYPFWLRDKMFGNHAWNCQCIPCRGLGNPRAPIRKMIAEQSDAAFVGAALSLLMGSGFGEIHATSAPWADARFGPRRERSAVSHAPPAKNV